jgi:hypothetical protein
VVQLLQVMVAIQGLRVVVQLLQVMVVIQGLRVVVQLLQVVEVDTEPTNAEHVALYI